MPFQNLMIDKFAGLNSTVHPNLIEIGQARDICNLRMERIGKLVNRDGYIFGLSICDDCNDVKMLTKYGKYNENVYFAQENENAVTCDMLMLYLEETIRDEHNLLYWVTHLHAVDNKGTHALYIDNPEIHFKDITVKIKTFPFYKTFYIYIENGEIKCTDILEDLTIFGGTGEGIILESDDCKVNDAYEFNAGMVGIGEITLEDKWEQFDTNRFMVYFIRGVNAFESTAKTNWEGMFLFSPMTGCHANCLIYDPCCVPSNRRLASPGDCSCEERYDIHKEGNTFNYGLISKETVPLYAPNHHALYLPGVELCSEDIASANIGDYYNLATYDGNEYRYDGYIKYDTDNWEMIPGGIRKERWIDNFTDMNQYRHRLIISDRINGDMQIRDSYRNRESSDCIKDEHCLELVPNTLYDFDINDIEIDYRTDDGEENSYADGVTTGMMLYNYILPKAYQVSTDDNAENKINNEDWLPSVAGLSGDVLRDQLKYIADLLAQYIQTADTRQVGTFLTALSFDRSREVTFTNLETYKDYGTQQFGSGYFVNQEERYTFTNGDNGAEYDDVTGLLEFSKDKYTVTTTTATGDKIEEEVEETYIDAHKWNDFEIPYYLNSGNTIDTQYFLTEADRFFDKLSAGNRIKTLKVKDRFGRQVPLGVWQYRFVWKFRDGTYSAPTSELVVGDLLWSATNDSMINPVLATNINTAFPDSVRPENQHGIPRLDTSVTPIEPSARTFTQNQLKFNSNPFGTPSAVDTNAFPILDSSNNLTEFGKIYYKLKYKLYSKVNNQYGIVDNAGTRLTLDPSLATWDSTWNGLDNDIKSGLLTQITCKIARKNVETKGSAFEYHCALCNAYPEYEGWEWWQYHITEQTLNPVKYVNTGASRTLSETPGTIFPHTSYYGSTGILIPIYQDSNDGRQYNSVFDDKGRLRTAWLNQNEVRFQLFLPGWYLLHQYAYQNDGSYHLLRLFIPQGDWGKPVFNIVCLPDDMNNDPLNIIDESRIYTGIRHVTKEQDRLTYMNQESDADSEALGRLVLEGGICIDLLKTPDDVLEIIPPQQDTIYLNGHIKRDYIRNYNYFGGGSTNHMIGTYGEKTYLNGMTRSAYYQNEYITAQNVDIKVYGEAERFIGVEQLTSYFPSSVIFEAPRVGLKIPNSKIPCDAEKLLIYRTKSSHSNDWDNTNFGLVQEVDLKRSTGDATDDACPETFDGQQVIPEGVYYTRTEEGAYSTANVYYGVYYFDDMKDDLLDFGVNQPTYYEGLRVALKSRFNMPLNERAYYSNYIETWQPQSPKGYKEDTLNGNQFDNIGYRIIDDAEGKYVFGVGNTETVSYILVYEDVGGVHSQASVPLNLDNIDLSNHGTSAIVLYFLPSIYDTANKRLEIYRSINDRGYYKIGIVEPEDEGIFVDNYVPDLEHLPCLEPSVINYESAVRWSEPYNPHWIKLTSMAEYRSGDGMETTGIESNYGNIVLFKENSMHRAAVQDEDPPVSRTDEISPEIGCIAPNACINVDNTLYFLSWKGLMKYDNNQLQKADAMFGEELQLIMKNIPEYHIRDASIGYNPHYDEIYLNIPMLKTLGSQRTNIKQMPGISGLGLQQDIYGQVDLYPFEDNTGWNQWFADSLDSFRKTIYGHIYVISQARGYATKYAYQATLNDYNDADNYLKEVNNSIQLIRKYYTNSLGEMRSGDILPTRYGRTISNQPSRIGINSGHNWAGIYIETPYQINEKIIKSYPNRTYTMRDTDHIFDYKEYQKNKINNSRIGFPYSLNAPIKSIFKSKFFAMENETIQKRIRKVLLNIFSKGQIDVSGVSIPLENMDEAMFETVFDKSIESFSYLPTVANKHPLGKIYASPYQTGRNTISFIPRVPQFTQTQANDDLEWNDFAVKPIRYGIDIETELRTEINAISFYWRPINKYLS